MIRSFLKFSLLATAASFVTAQDQGEGFIFQCDKPGVFALTFDDGPSEYTGTLLATLKEKQIKATFFSVGTQAAKAGISKYLKQAYDEGHQIASHTNTHADLNKLTASQIKSEMELTEKAIQAATGLVPAVMRPPYGNCNQQCRDVMKEMGYLVVQWNVDSNDWKFMDMPDKWNDLVTNIVGPVEKSNTQTQSFISLQHDIHKFSVERTATIIDAIKAKNYKFETVNDCLSNRFPMYKNKANPQTNQTTSALPSSVSTSAAPTSTSVAPASTSVAASASSAAKPAQSVPAIPSNDKVSVADNHAAQNAGSAISIPAFGVGLVAISMVAQILL
ncbi:glycoside hydrolase/deacetylase [Basidiobolus meristosporus CBS 931.73]|uniref:Glycoside hydrolase/deacetylase n=1 Tax=Basidiobolus meristosporus CBS 931.73 TaxID=1314790 RepID=A0A1Y1XRS2_9FUNG|nr:glycoside hydrolase/deacetylase [Basidiobolus meristosporus CBS 931.73]|eukprot:ORX88469.1 glycoside hydrolase/deacetylase [Basidiobolus meristosporus CBS 931.73]